MIFTINMNLGEKVEPHIFVDMSLREYGNYFWFVVNAFLGIACSILLFKMLNLKSRLLQFIGENSVVFYLLNGFNIFVLDNFVVTLNLVPKGTIPAFLFSIGYIFVSQLVLLPLAYLLVKYSPLLVGRYRFGKSSSN